MLLTVALIALLQVAQTSTPTDAQTTPSTVNSPSPTPSVATATVATAARARKRPVIDGRDDDEVWRKAQLITGFRQFSPVANGDASFRTEAKVAYDDQNFYVFIRMYDPHPDSILRLLGRRDVRVATDQIKIIIDSYHDLRTGYEFAVNPAGVKRDYAVYSDINEDGSWDGVWEAGTTVDSLGWTAEFRIPLSQLRYADAPTHTFGFGIWRDIDRYKERDSWPVYRQSDARFMSQLGTVEKIDGIPSPHRLEVSPYVVTKNVSVDPNAGNARSQKLSAGANVKYGLTSNLTLDATINPDFGQVESDPSVLNLSAFETFFAEQRPFFLEGTGIYSFQVNCNVVNCNNEGLFYSRRIGRSPQLGYLYGDATSPTSTTILGATKLTGRLASGTSIGVLDAVTQRADGPLNQTLEPTTNYAVVRAQQDLRGGESGIGVILTGVNRKNDDFTRDVLNRDAYVAATDFRHRFAGRRYEITGSIDASRVSGTPQSMLSTQRDAVHYFQQPDGSLHFDSLRTSLTGDAEQITFGKVGGGVTRFQTSYNRMSPGFETNDLGYLQRADLQNWSNWFSLQFLSPALFFNSAYFNFNEWNYWNSSGLLLERAVNTNWHFILKDNFEIDMGGTASQLPGTFSDRASRGGPAVRHSPFFNGFLVLMGDNRKQVIPMLQLNTGRSDYGRGHYYDLNPSVDLRVSSRFHTNLGVDYNHNRDDTQWYGNFTDTSDVTHYTFAHLDQRTLSATLRLDVTLTPNLTFQLYASPFVTKGSFTNIRELNDPRAKNFDDRYKPYTDQTVLADQPTGFNVKQFRSNAVVRWEYRPGSALFLVWTQQRQGDLPLVGDNSFSGDYRGLFNLHPDNTFLVKLSYWFNR
ncbi:MAG: carbohydrate binding family 9 domain-containing protein [Gemmatimonadaceae bacterium]|nr:carbohydrate binding family 9 domain-containing protein [Gemmatimonadaceae bacterium]